MADILLKDKNGADVICENVKSVRFRTVDGSSVSFGEKQEFNIAYGDEPPEDTSKLWIKCNTPEDVRIIPPSLIGKDDLSALYSDGEITTLEEKLPVSLYSMSSSVAIDNQIYLLGGVGTSESSGIRRFDVNTKSITTLDVKLPQGAYSMASATVGKKVYLFGGYKFISNTYSNNTLSAINVFDIDTQTVSTLSPTYARFESTAVAAENKIYLMGGARYMSAGSSSLSTYSTISVFDTDTETLSTVSASLTKSASGVSAEIINNKIYIFGGKGKEDYYDTISVLDIDNNAMTILGVTLPTALFYASSALIGNRIYLFGGMWKGVTPTGFLDTIYMFDIETNTVTTLSTKLPIATYRMTSCQIGTKVYLFGGYNGIGTTINVFETATKFHLDKNNALVITNPTDNLFDLLPNVTVGAELAYIGNANNEAEPVEAYIYKDGAWTLI